LRWPQASQRGSSACATNRASRAARPGRRAPTLRLLLARARQRQTTASTVGPETNIAREISDGLDNEEHWYVSLPPAGAEGCDPRRSARVRRPGPLYQRVAALLRCRDEPLRIARLAPAMRAARRAQASTQYVPGTAYADAGSTLAGGACAFAHLNSAASPCLFDDCVPSRGALDRVSV
jgi:hypothetical protein